MLEKEWYGFADAVKKWGIPDITLRNAMKKGCLRVLKVHDDYNNGGYDFRYVVNDEYMQEYINDPKTIKNEEAYRQYVEKYRKRNDKKLENLKKRKKTTTRTILVILKTEDESDIATLKTNLKRTIDSTGLFITNNMKVIQIDRENEYESI
jgi:hypothetical protein